MRQQKGFGERFLVVYSGALTLALAVIVFSGFSFRSEKKASLDELTVQRINVVEPDGTLRLVISDTARFPGAYIKGKEVTRPDRSGNGFLFMDDEGTEIGGQMWSGSRRDGKTSSSGHLSFDRYNGDQTFVVNTGEGDGHTGTVLQINDSFTGIEKALEAVRKMEALPAEQQPAAQAEFKRNFPLTHRVALGREDDGSVMLKLSDLQGRSRIALNVAADGSPSIELLDEAGKVIGRLPEAKH